MLQQKLKQIKQGKLTAEANIKQFLNKINSENSKLNIILHINNQALKQAKEIDKKIKEKKSGKLAGLGVVIKSNINVKDLIANCASKTLEDYKSTYNATVIDLLLSEDAIILGMANMDEFACGSSGETSAYGICKNPKALDRISGGSSSGPAASIAADFCDFALGTDTGGSIRNPSSHCGVVGFKPTYGTVSRYGLIDLSMSLDQIGPITKTINDTELVYDIIKGKDENDASTTIYNNQKKSTNKIKIAILQTPLDKDIQELISNKISQTCESNKWTFKDIKLSHTDLGIETYYPINYVEFFSGTRKFDGRKYGKKIEDSCGEEVLRRILGGQEISKEEYSGKYYRRALKAKKIIENDFIKAFESFDIIITPTVPKLPHKLNTKISVEDMYNYDFLTVLANLAEIPAISIPCGTINSIPVGIQLMAKKGDDNFLLQIAKKFE